MAAFTSITSDTDLQRIAIWDELARAVWERSLFSGYPLFAYPAGGVFVAAGADITKVVASTGHILAEFCAPRKLQRQTEALAKSTAFLVAPAAPAKAASFPVYGSADFAAFCADAGMSPDGWRRATVYDPATDDWTDLDDPMWTREGNGFGWFSVGDIFGPWLVDDLQKALTRLDVIKGASYWNDLWEDGTDQAASVSYGEASGWAATTALLASVWPETSSGGSSAPECQYTGRISSGNYSAYARANQARLQGALGIGELEEAYRVKAASLGAQIAWYAMSDAPHTSGSGVDKTYDAGSTGLAQGVFATFGTTALTSAWLQGSPMLGALDQPAESGEPTLEVPIKTRGYRVSSGSFLISPTYTHSGQ
jgi:hypothetical protein